MLYRRKEHRLNLDQGLKNIGKRLETKEFLYFFVKSFTIKGVCMCVALILKAEGRLCLENAPTAG